MYGDDFNEITRNFQNSGGMDNNFWVTMDFGSTITDCELSDSGLHVVSTRGITKCMVYNLPEFTSIIEKGLHQMNIYILVINICLNKIIL